MEDEVLFDDITAGEAWNQKSGATKVHESCKTAKTRGYGYIWIDTCCIDKSSSAELSEAINSMFRWYEMSDICFAYLADVAEDSITENSTYEDFASTLASSKWFTRGWTLQELVAPKQVVFFNKHWEPIGDKFRHAPELSKITGIQILVLRRGHGSIPPRWKDHVSVSNKCICGCRSPYISIRAILRSFSTAQKMCWASKRETTREEDTAYCLFGLFEINMPLLYGEGGPKAFFRLQKQIIRQSNDQSIVAFSRYKLFSPSPLADSPRNFEGGDSIYPRTRSENFDEVRYQITTSDQEIVVELLVCPLADTETVLAALLDCSIDGDPFCRPVILISAEQDTQNGPRYNRADKELYNTTFLPESQDCK